MRPEPGISGGGCGGGSNRLVVVGGSADGGRVTGWLFNSAFVPGQGLMRWQEAAEKLE